MPINPVKTWGSRYYRAIPVRRVQHNRPNLAGRHHHRCPEAQLPRCQDEVPAYRQTAPDHWVACHFRWGEKNLSPAKIAKSIFI